MQLPLSAWSSNLALIRFIVLEIFRFLYFAVLAGNCLFTPIFGEFWGHIFPKYGHHRSNPQKDHPCAETRRLSHKAWKSGQRFDLGALLRKKVRTGRDSQESHKVVIFRLSHCTDWNRNLHGRYLADVITYAKFQDDILGGTILQGVEFPIFLLIFAWALQQCSATALTVIDLAMTLTFNLELENLFSSVHSNEDQLGNTHSYLMNISRQDMLIDLCVRPCTVRAAEAYISTVRRGVSLVRLRAFWVGRCEFGCHYHLPVQSTAGNRARELTR